MTNPVNVPALAHSIQLPTPAPALPVDRAQEAAFLINQLHSELARKVLPVLLQEMATGNASWRNTRWLLQFVGDDQGKLSIPRLSVLPAV